MRQNERRMTISTARAYNSEETGMIVRTLIVSTLTATLAILASVTVI